MHSRYSHILFHLLLVTILNAHGANPYDIINSVTADAVTEWKILCADDGRPRRLYGIAGSTVFVVDLDRNQVIKQFTSEFAVDAFALVPKYHCAFYLAGRDSKLNVLDLNTFKLARGNGMKAGKRPEAVVIKSDASMGYVLNAGDPSVTVFEPDDGDLVGTIPLPGTPRSAVYDQKSHGLFISIGDRNEIAFAVPRAKIAIKTWLVSPGERPSEMALEPAMEQLLVGCGNKKLVMLETGNGKVVNTVDVDSGADKLVYDPVAKLVFATGDTGIIAVFHVDSPLKLSLVQKLRPPDGAQCMAVDAKTHNLYVGGKGPKILVYGPSRP